jgi:hypothetical protein
MAAVSADGSTVRVLILRLNCRSIAFVVRSLRHGFVFEPPLADEGFAVFFDSLRDLVMRALRSVREEITCLCMVHLCTAISRRAVLVSDFPFRPCWLAYLMVRWVISRKSLSEPR